MVLYCDLLKNIVMKYFLYFKAQACAEWQWINSMTICKAFEQFILWKSYTNKFDLTGNNYNNNK